MDVVYSVYLANLGVNFSVWANNIPDGVQTGVLLGLVLYYEYQDEIAGKDNFGHRVPAEKEEEGKSLLFENKLASSNDCNYGSISISIDCESDIDIIDDEKDTHPSCVDT